VCVCTIFKDRFSFEGNETEVRVGDQVVSCFVRPNCLSNESYDKQVGDSNLIIFFLINDSNLIMSATCRYKFISIFGWA
jgi:hypothetical protein